MKLEKEIFDFWFFDFPESGVPAEPHFKKWFQKDPRFDQEIRKRFENSLKKAAQGELDSMMETPSGALALIILLDQFSRNMYRETPQAFAQDSKALELARRAVNEGLDQKVPFGMRMFFYLPFEHSESIHDQNESVRLFEQWTAKSTQETGEAGERFAQEVLKYAYSHQEVIQKYGRFPHRNGILDRSSTVEEKEYLAQPGAGF